METTNIEIPQCKGETHLQIEGEQSPSTARYCLICNKDISGRQNAKYCIGCSLDKKKKYIKEWIKNNKDKHNQYSSNWKKNNPIKNKKYINKWKRRNPEKQKKYMREYTWRKKEEKQLNFEKRIFINYCIICNQDISMYPSQTKLCDHCKEKSLHELGTITASQHMRRKYDDVTKTIIPDFERERQAIDTMLSNCGLK